MYAHLKSATELQLLIAVLSLFHMFAPDIVCVCARARVRVCVSVWLFCVNMVLYWLEVGYSVISRLYFISSSTSESSLSG